MKVIVMAIVCRGPFMLSEMHSLIHSNRRGGSIIRIGWGYTLFTALEGADLAGRCNKVHVWSVNPRWGGIEYLEGWNSNTASSNTLQLMDGLLYMGRMHHTNQMNWYYAIELVGIILCSFSFAHDEANNEGARGQQDNEGVPLVKKRRREFPLLVSINLNPLAHLIVWSHHHQRHLKLALKRMKCMKVILLIRRILKPPHEHL